MRALPRSAQVYIGVVAAAALAVVVVAFFRSLPWLTLGVLALVLLAAESGSKFQTRKGVRLSASFAVVLASVVLVGPWGAALVAGAGVLAHYPDGPLPPVKRLYNGSQYVICGLSAGFAYQAIAPDLNGSFAPDDFPWLIVPFAVAVATHLVVNLLLLTGVLWLAEGVTPTKTARVMLSSWVWTYLGNSTLGLVIAAMWSSIGVVAAVLALLPLVVARWAFTQYAAEQEAYDSTIAALCKAVETKDYYTRGHCERVARASVLMGRELGMREGRVNNLHYAGMMHDVGKLGVPTRVLQKDGFLTEEEFAAIQLHPTRGVEIVREVEFLDEARAGVAHHHERLDGRGYPSGLAGPDIPEFARVIAVADAFDSMTSTRSYRGARSPQAAIEELRRHAGTQFDPAMVKALVTAVDRHGWQPHEPAVAPDGVPTTAVRDHDDPGAALPLAGGGPST